MIWVLYNVYLYHVQRPVCTFSSYFLNDELFKRDVSMYDWWWDNIGSLGVVTLNKHQP